MNEPEPREPEELDDEEEDCDELPNPVRAALAVLSHVRWVETPNLLFVPGAAPLGRSGRHLNVYEGRAADVAVQVIEKYLRRSLEDEPCSGQR